MLIVYPMTETERQREKDREKEELEDDAMVNSSCQL